MASTYSTNLAIELIGTGDQAGSWGTTTNTNLGTLIEQAISGYVTQAITDGADTVITIPNGASGVARNMYIELTGTLTAARNLIVPANKKLYFIYNNTTGGYAVTVKVSGQTGVSVANGNKVILVSNGTDIVTAAGSTIAGFTTGTSTALGTSALSSLTSGAQSSAFGYEALKLQSTANWNTAVGYQAGKSVTSGSANTFIGWNAGAQVSSGGTNVALGDSAYTGTNYSTSMCLGQGSQVTGSTQNQIGMSGTTTYAYGAVQDRSDARDKTDIQDTNLGLNFVMALKPRMFRWDMRDDYRPKMPDLETATPEEIAAWQEACDLGNITHDGSKKRTRYHQGLIAQEVKATMDAMGVDFGGYQNHSVKGGQDVLSIGYTEMIAPLIKAIQELKAEFDEYKRTHP
ncbi:hypothetical protein EBZ39_08985 [bacterium]|nr:hypothetical protein [bacterium]